MKSRKLMAGILTVTMLAGSSMTIFAEDANSATGSGTSFDHVDKEITKVTLPTQAEVANIFDYYVDPERAINDAKTLTDGTTAVTPNNDGVYFLTATGDDGSKTYASTSKAVNFKGQNSVDVDVSVNATVTPGNADKDIALVEDDAALTAATGPALLMTLKVGSESKAITSSGTTAKATIAGVVNNFEVKADGTNGKFVYGVKDDADEDSWNSTTVQLAGKTNQKDIPTGNNAMTTPTINLTWTIAKHVTAPTYTEETGHGNWSAGVLWLAKDSSTGFSSSSLTVEVSEDGTNYSTVATDKYTVDGNNWISMPWASITETLGAEPSGTYYVRVIDGTVRYTTTY